MIEKIIVIPRHAIEGLFERTTWVSTNFKSLTDVAIISIFSYEGDHLITEKFEKRLKQAGCVDILSLLFGDITNNEAEASLDKDLRTRLFTSKQARAIINFLDFLKTKPVKILLIHCDAGISRSGAVGIFACRYFGLNESLFRIENPNIQPNPYVYGTLYRESGLRKSYEDFWTIDAWKNIPIDPDIERMFK